MSDWVGNANSIFKTLKIFTRLFGSALAAKDTSQKCLSDMVTRSRQLI